MGRNLKGKILVGVMVSLAAFFCLAAFYLIPHIYNLSTVVDFVPDSGVYENPLIGYCHWAKDEKHGSEGQLVYVDVTWAEWEPKEGEFDIKGFEERNHIPRWRSEGKHAVLRFVCDRPGDGEHMDIPRWLYEKTGDGSFYDTDYGRGYAPNYENPEFLAAHKRALAALGNYCNQDTFFSYVQLGSLGHWGEWHTKYEDGVTPMPDADVCWEYANQYSDSFINARLLMRRNYVMAVDGQMGVYNDMTGLKKDTEEWLTWMKEGGSYETPGRKIPYKAVENIWNTAPVGGEFTSRHTIEQMLGPDFKETLSLVERSHMTFIGPHSPVGDQLLLPGAQELLKRVGYRYLVTRMDIDMDYLKQTFKIKLTWRNDGVAPIYFNWPAMMYVYDKSGELRYWEEIRIDLPKLYQGQTAETVNDIPFNDLFREGYTIGIGILDPETGQPCVELAMNKEYQQGVNIIYSFDGEKGTAFGE